VVHQLASRTTVQLHGVAFGGGIEIAAFAGTVEADPATRIALPELGLGLIPGAGGTVSLTRRIGRQRTAALALCGREIDAGTALEWGLVDRITSRRPVPCVEQ
jgi:enoyl-CoA hydratase/carnithine racemase